MNIRGVNHLLYAVHQNTRRVWLAWHTIDMRRATPHRTPCPLRTILLANGALFVFGVLGYLAYLLR